MRIVYCIPATSNSGGMERVLTRKVNYLAGQGHELIIVTTDQKGVSHFSHLKLQSSNMTSALIMTRIMVKGS